MPRPRGPEVPQRPSLTTRGPRHLRTSSSDSDPLQQRPITDRSPRFVDRRSPRGSQTDPLNQKKLGTRITDLETQLVQAQHELKSLKHQLSSAEAAKKHAQEELHSKKGTKKSTASRRVQQNEKRPAPVEIPVAEEAPEEVHQETDVFEVPIEKNVDNRRDMLLDSNFSEPEKPSSGNESTPRGEETDQIRSILEVKEQEMQAVKEENETLKKQLDDVKSEIALAQSKEEEMALKLIQLQKQIDESKVNEARLHEELQASEAVKESLESEMKRMTVQTEQWRKAADAAASVLAGGAELHGRISERCASMDNHFNGIFEQPPITGFGGYLCSPVGGDDGDDGFGGGKKKSSGMRMLGDFWKKKSHK